MKQDWVFYFQVISTFSVLLPIGIGFMHLKGIDDVFKAFIGFLIVGFVVDLAGGFFYFTGFFWNGNDVIKYAYNLFEPIFLIWFLGHLSSNSKLKLILINSWMIVLPLWLISVFFNEFFPIYVTITQFVIAFTSCFCILEVVENDSKIINSFAFWVLIGIFFDNFCNFFLLLPNVITGAYLLPFGFFINIYNTITYGFYTIGFWKYYETQKLIHALRKT